MNVKHILGVKVNSIKTSTIIMSQSTDFPEPKSLTTMLKSLVKTRSFYCMFLSRAPRSLGKISSFALSRTDFALTRSGYLGTRPLQSFVIHTNTFFHAVYTLIFLGFVPYKFYKMNQIRLWLLFLSLNSFPFPRIVDLFPAERLGSSCRTGQ